MCKIAAVLDNNKESTAYLRDKSPISSIDSNPCREPSSPSQSLGEGSSSSLSPNEDGWVIEKAQTSTEGLDMVNSRLHFKSCRFPISLDSCVENANEISTIQIPRERDVLTDEVRAETYTRTLSLAWACLLREYVRTDHVAFGWIDGNCLEDGFLKAKICTFDLPMSM